MLHFNEGRCNNPIAKRERKFGAVCLKFYKNLIKGMLKIFSFSKVLIDFSISKSSIIIKR